MASSRATGRIAAHQKRCGKIIQPQRSLGITGVLNATNVSSVPFPLQATSTRLQDMVEERAPLGCTQMLQGMPFWTLECL